MVLPQVGKAKLGVLKGEHVLSQTTFRVAGSADYDPVDEYITAVKEVEKPAFNVLYVESQRPHILKFPLVKGLLDTVQETVELVKPIFRLGLPETSVKDKCPHYRDVGSSEGRAAPMRLMSRHQQHVVHCINDRSLFAHPKQHIHPTHFYLHEPPALGMVAINFVALYAILNYANKG